MVFFGYFCQQYIADFRRNEERKSASCISCIGVDNSNTSPDIEWLINVIGIRALTLKKDVPDSVAVVGISWTSSSRL